MDARRKGAGIEPEALRTTGLAFEQKLTECRTPCGRACCSPSQRELRGRRHRWAHLPGSTDPAKYKKLSPRPDLLEVEGALRVELAKADIAATDQVVVCEGYTASSGSTRRRQGPWRRAARRSPRARAPAQALRQPVVLAFDADAAGRVPPSASTMWSSSTRCRCRWPAARGSRPRTCWQDDPQALAAPSPTHAFLAFRGTGDRRSPGRTPEDRARLAERAMEVVNEHPDANVRKLYAGRWRPRSASRWAHTRAPRRAAHPAPDGQRGPVRRTASGRTPSSSPSAVLAQD
jgi:DNA primase